MSTMQPAVILVLTNTCTVRATFSSRTPRFKGLWRRTNLPAGLLNQRAVRSICAKLGATAYTKTLRRKLSDRRRQTYP